MEQNMMFGSPEEQRLMEALVRQMETSPIEKVSVSALLRGEKNRKILERMFDKRANLWYNQAI